VTDVTLNMAVDDDAKDKGVEDYYKMSTEELRGGSFRGRG